MERIQLLADALERWKGWEQGDPFDPGTLDIILEAARNYVTGVPMTQIPRSGRPLWSPRGPGDLTEGWLSEPLGTHT